MVTTDVNLLIYAHDEESPYFANAKIWLENLLASPEPIGIPFQAILAFIRITTNPRLRVSAFTVSEALEIIGDILAMPQVRIHSPGPEHWLIYERSYRESGASGKLSTDVHLAALAIEHGATLHTADRDFARFPGLRWTNPLGDDA